MSWIKDNGGILAVGAVVLVVFGALADWRISVKVAQQLAEANIVPKHEVTELRKDVGENSEDIDDIEDRWNRLVDALAAGNQ